MKSLILLFFTLLAARTIEAHDEPTSYVDLRPAPDGMTITVLASTTDLAHYLPAVEPDMLLQPAVLTAQQAVLNELINSRLRCSTAGAALTLETTALVGVPDKRDIRMEFKAAWPQEPASLTVECQLFPYDPRHRTFLTVHRGDAVERTEIFQDAVTSIVIPLGTSQSTFQVVGEFFTQGIHHIFIGPDHILFVVGLLLLGGGLGRLLKIVTAFTVAHSITLGLATFNILSPPAAIIEPVIALSIVFVGIHAILPGRKRDPRLIFAFTFGLIHGFGFAFALQDLSLPRAALGWSLLAFNGGVEAGQACIVLLVAPLFALLRRRDPRLSKHIVTACAACVTLAGLFWFVERVMA